MLNIISKEYNNYKILEIFEIKKDLIDPIKIFPKKLF